eukprot:m.229505 g.229505  ORF g.229505 m.229505 type:complete len:227 (-) comp11916_c0_seq1:86-766(-)
MIEEDLESSVKVLIVGNGAVGKSSMIQRYCKGIFTNEYRKTIGVDFLDKKIKIDNYDLRMMIWDTAGQDEFTSITKAYYRDAEACVVAFSTTDRASFEAVENWIKKVEEEVGSIPMILIQNKIDLVDKAVVTPEEAKALAEKVKLKFVCTSVQENYNVDQVFQYLGQEYIKRLKEREDAAHKATGSTAAAGAPTQFAAKPKQTDVIRIDQPKRRTGGKKQSACMLL